jgi:hypothetical protein
MPKEPRARARAEWAAAGRRWRAVVERQGPGLAAAWWAEEGPRRDAARIAGARAEEELQNARAAASLRGEGMMIGMTMSVREMREAYRAIRDASGMGARTFDQRVREMVGAKPSAGMWLAAAQRIQREKKR